MIRLLGLLLIAFAIVVTIILTKFKPVYQVTLDGVQVGYIQNKENFEKLIQEEIIEQEGENIAFTDLTKTPSYEFTLADIDQTNESEIFSQIQESAVTTYRLYAVAVNNEQKEILNSQEEAQNAVENLEQEYADKIEGLNITVQEVFTQDMNTPTVEVASVVTSLEKEFDEQIAIQEEIKASTFNGIYFSVKPVTGTITSRFGANESIRDHTHKGMDIAAPGGTPIKASAGGEITYSGWMGGYGNLVIIDHGNGVQTYYGHCSKLYVDVGEQVTAGDTIAAVGTTGNSTGNHLHFEIRKNGTQVNPQKYVYR